MRSLRRVIIENTPNLAQLIEQREPDVDRLQAELEGAIVFEPQLARWVLDRIARNAAEHAAAAAARAHIEGAR